MKTRVFLVAALMLAALSLSPKTFAADITVSDAWARATPPKAKSAAAYLGLKINSGEADRLIAVKSAIAKKTQIHRTTMENGIMKMGRVEGIDVPAGGMAMLKPGGHHVMFMGLKQQLKEGSHFPLTLVFAKAGEVTAMVKVMKPGGMGHHHHH